MNTLPTGATIILDDLPPRGWTDTCVPVFPEGCDRLEFYTRWLADHLTTCQSTPHRRQQEFLDNLHLPWNEILADYEEQSLGAMLNLAKEAIEIIEASHAAGETWNQFKIRQEAAYHRNHSDEGWHFENEYCCQESTWVQIGEEWRERESLPNLPDFPDIPYRPYIAAEIKARPEFSPQSIVENFMRDINFLTA